MGEMPLMTASSYSSSTMDAKKLWDEYSAERNRIGGGLAGIGQAVDVSPMVQAVANMIQQKEQAMAAARIVKVFIADSNENIPLDKRVLYSGEEKLTDLTDQELFFEVSINDLLTKHNEFRKTVIDKAQAEKFGRDIYLEPARIRDLKMVVVTVASF
jgi:hypothetical protein